MENKTIDFENKKQEFTSKLNELVAEYHFKGLNLQTLRSLLQIKVSRITDELI